jgi:hypothetical protein
MASERIFRWTAIFFLLTIIFAAACGSSHESFENNSSTPKPTASPAPELEMSGQYRVNGTDDLKANPYDGTLDITNQGDVYAFNWHTTISRPGGVGIQLGDAVAATFADSTNGKGCGVALYKIASDGSLDGKIARWGEYTFTTEKATKLEGKNFDGKYLVKGSYSDGKPYEGTIDVTKNGKGYQFDWKTDKNSVGFGIWRGNRAAISFGGTQCGFALYQIMGGRSMDGHWGGQKQVTFGTESAKRY